MVVTGDDFAPQGMLVTETFLGAITEEVLLASSDWRPGMQVGNPWHVGPTPATVVWPQLSVVPWVIPVVICRDHLCEACLRCSGPPLYLWHGALRASPSRPRGSAPLSYPWLGAVRQDSLAAIFDSSLAFPSLSRPLPYTRQRAPSAEGFLRACASPLAPQPHRGQGLLCGPGSVK